MQSVRDKDSIMMRGDVDEFFKKAPDTSKTSEQLKVFKEIERLYKKT
jgi:hypothetical protein